ncbi:hypothetical protein RND81_14G154200 [Saponaria officinalis]|uniref:Ubiquitin-like protease family profile domain-containing protein n=1 Tax=Saponaria officinalis TaxID=3572 RepID=A0AAW1GQL9_SAPOF
MGAKRKSKDKEREKPGVRGRTIAPRAQAAQEAGTPLSLTWDDETGLPTGPNATDFASWVGVQTKQYVPIDTEDFRKLNPKLHELLLEPIRAAFIVPDCYKDYCLSRAAESLRQWKVNVSRYHLYVDKNTGEMKSHPPSKYPNISQTHWDKFKAYRASDKFKAVSKRNGENIAKKDSIFYGSRGGYRLVKETLEKVLKEFEEGKFTPTGREDILAKAIGRPEHPGRLRGVPLHVGVTKLFGKTPHKKRKATKYTEQMVQLLASVVLKINAGGKASEEELKMIESILPNKDNNETDIAQHEKVGADEVLSDTDEEMSREAGGNSSKKKTSPALEISVNDKNSTKGVPVAHAHMYLHDQQEKITVHSSPLLTDHRKVSVIQVFKDHENDPLPVPVRDELTILRDAVNGFVQWPSKHIHIKVPKKTARDPKDDISTSTHSLPKDQVQEPKRKPLPAPEYQGNSYNEYVRTETMKLLRSEAEIRLASEFAIIVELDAKILGYKLTSYVSWDILAIWAGLGKIDVQHLYVWMKYLSSQAIIGNEVPYDYYGFMCPSMLSMHIVSVTYSERVDYIARQLTTSKRLIFAPYNEKGDHWVLAAIMPSTKKVFWLDSYHGLPSETFMDLIRKAFEKKRELNSLEQVLVKDDTPPTFIPISGCDRQTDSIQCGYYVCRFMWEIIKHRYIVIPPKYLVFQHNPDPYSFTIQQIDEIRDLWGKFVLQTASSMNDKQQEQT